MVDYLGLDILLARTTENPEESRKSIKDRGFFAAKLAQGIVEMADYVVKGKSVKFPEQLGRWRTMSRRAKMEVRKSEEAALIPTLQRKTSDRESLLASQGKRRASLAASH
jgi:hypothetical protein